MFQLPKIALVTAALLFGFPLLTFGGSCPSGGDCSGGGNRPTSTDAEVKKVVDEIYDIYNVIGVYANQEQLFNPSYAQDPALKAALELGIERREITTPEGNITVRDNGLFSKRFPTFKLEPACFDHKGNEVEASTEFKPGAKVCLNQKLLKKYSPRELRLQLGALAYHEVIHQRQAEPQSEQQWDLREAEADALQKHIERNVGGIFPYLDHLAELRKASVSGSFSYEVRAFSLRPNGKINLKGEGKNISISCNRETENLLNLNQRLIDDSDLLLAPGGVMVVASGKSKQGKKQFTAVTCLDIPRVRCSIGKIGKLYAFHLGDSRGSVSLEAGRKKMAALVESGVCQDVSGTASEKAQKDGPSSESNYDAR